MATNRSYGQNQPPYPGSPAPTTASSLNYSTYASSQFTSPSRHATANAHVSSGSYGGGGGAGSGRPQPSRSQTDGGPGLRPPGGSARPKGESREVAKVHWRALRDFLREWLEKGESLDREGEINAEFENHLRLGRLRGRNLRD